MFSELKDGLQTFSSGSLNWKTSNVSFELYDTIVLPARLQAVGAVGAGLSSRMTYKTLAPLSLDRKTTAKSGT